MASGNIHSWRTDVWIWLLGIALLTTIAVVQIVASNATPLSALYIPLLLLGMLRNNRSTIAVWAGFCGFFASLPYIFQAAGSDQFEALGLASTLTAIAIIATLMWSRSQLALRGEQLSDTVRDLKVFADSVPQVLWGTRADGYCDFLNARYTEVFGIATEIAIRDQSWAAPLHPDDKAKMYKLWREAIEGGASDYRAYARFRQRDGTYRWMQSVGRSVRAAQTGNVVRWYGGLVDVDAEVRAQQTIERLNSELQGIVDARTSRLEDVEWRLQALSEDRNIGVLELDFGDSQIMMTQLASVDNIGAYLSQNLEAFAQYRKLVRTVEVNETVIALLGYRDRDHFESSLKNNGNGAAAAIVLRLIDALNAAKDATSGTITIDSAQGSKLRIGYAASFKPDGTSYVTILDFSEREKAQEAIIRARTELARANRVAVAGALSVSVLHDISQPLTAMSIDVGTAVRMAGRDGPNDQTLLKVLERVKWNAQRLMEITNQTRDRIQLHQRMIEPIDVLSSVREACRLMEQDASRRSSTIKLVAPSDVCLVFADRTELQQVFVHLLLNALDAVSETDGKREIEVRTAVTPDRKSIVIEVSDTGPGIAEQDLSRIFEPFFTTRPNGLGFGLQISRATVEAIGGEIVCRNRTSGGAVFSVRLPLAADKE